jgi:hypothetical protein
MSVDWSIGRPVTPGGTEVVGYLGCVKRKLRVVATLALVLIAAVAAGQSAGASGGSLRRVGAHFAYLETGLSDGACHWTVGVEFGSVPGATSYLVKYWDGFFGKLASTPLTAAQFQDSLVPKGKLATGWHFLDITGGAYSPPCGRMDFSGEMKRFNRGAKAWAVIPPKAPNKP